MNKPLAILTLALQIVSTFIATFCIYMVFALVDSDFGYDGLLGILVFQPIFAIVISVLTILVCLIVGLPIRLYNKLNIWWTTNFYVPIIGIVIGLAFLVLSLVPITQETATHNIGGLVTFKRFPNSVFSYIGWLLTAFSILHTFPPRQLTEKVKAFFKRG